MPVTLDFDTQRRTLSVATASGTGTDVALVDHIVENEIITIPPLCNSGHSSANRPQLPFGRFAASFSRSISKLVPSPRFFS